MKIRSQRIKRCFTTAPETVARLQALKGRRIAKNYGKVIDAAIQEYYDRHSQSK